MLLYRNVELRPDNFKSKEQYKSFELKYIITNIKLVVPYENIFIYVTVRSAPSLPTTSHLYMVWRISNLATPRRFRQSLVMSRYHHFHAAVSCYLSTVPSYQTGQTHQVSFYEVHLSQVSASIVTSWMILAFDYNITCAVTAEISFLFFKSNFHCIMILFTI